MRSCRASPPLRPGSNETQPTTSRYCSTPRPLARPSLMTKGDHMPRNAPSSSPEVPNPGSPYRRLLPRDVEVEPDPLLIRLDFHRESVVLHEYADGLASSRLVSTIDIAHALASEL